MLGAIDELVQTYKGERRWRIERTRPVDPANFGPYYRLQIIATLQPVRFAPGTVAPMAGQHIAFGSDFPLAPPNPFAGIAAAMTAAAAPAQTVISGFSTGAAYAARAEDQIGSLTPGRWADFLLIDRDIFRLLPSEIAATRVLESWIGGKRAWVASSTPAPRQPLPSSQPLPPSQPSQQGWGENLR